MHVVVDRVVVGMSGMSGRGQATRDGLLGMGCRENGMSCSSNKEELLGMSYCGWATSSIR